PVDLVIHNARVYAADRAGTFAEAVAVRGNQILSIGSNREILRLRRPQTVVIDAGGGALLPGFNDSHVHLIDGGLSLDDITLTEDLTLDAIQTHIRDWAAARPDRAWVVGRGWHPDAFPDGTPTRQMLDALVPDRPAQIVSHDGQASWVNTKALHLAGITKRTADPDHGAIARDARSGDATGVLKESAMTLVDRLVPRPTSADRARALRAAIAEAHRYGVTSIQNVGTSAEDLDLYDELSRAGDLKVRVYAALSIPGTLSEEDAARIDATWKRYPDDPLLKTGAVEIPIDGGIASHTAAMLQPLEDGETSGTPLVAPDELNRTVRIVDARGWQVMTHAAGDRAVRMALNAYEHAVRSNAAPARGRRHRVEHVEATDAEDLGRFGSLGVIASMQPFQGGPVPSNMETWARTIGSERPSRGWAYRTIAQRKGRLAFGSDWPAGAFNPMLALHTAVNQTTVEGTPVGGWFPDQRLKLTTAVNAYTSGAAWASFDELRKGSITPGMLADLTVLSTDIFAAPPRALATTRVALTVFDGKVVYRQPDRRQTN
ncbi:MAG: amidohydrolase, partial [Acidobacteria bacterium]|nr:amidohydrolase [Acidobacteriota bacterium]